MTALIPEMDFTRPGMVDPSKIIATARKYKATTMFGSPALLNRVGSYGAAQGITLPHMKRVISAGAPVPAAILERFASLLPEDAEIFTPYGATEALPVCSIGSREILSETSRATGEGQGICVGRPVRGPVPGDYHRSPMSRLQSGMTICGFPPVRSARSCVRGPQVTAAYFNRPEATRLAKIADPNGGFWHRMGDLGYLDDTGRVWFCGRKSHRVITAQGALYTIPVEGVFNTHPEVFRTALVGIGRAGQPAPGALCRTGKGGKQDRKKPESGVSCWRSAHAFPILPG